MEKSHLCSLPLYEGVDWNIFSITLVTKATCASPSLRGSGLKSKFISNCCGIVCLPLYEGVDWNNLISFKLNCEKGLPLYEGVDWNRNTQSNVFANGCLPLYEGVDWNNIRNYMIDMVRSLPLYEGVDWNFFCKSLASTKISVSLFTREWIEIAWLHYLLYHNCWSPSLRGSGLK